MGEIVVEHTVSKVGDDGGMVLHNFGVGNAGGRVSIVVLLACLSERRQKESGEEWARAHYYRCQRCCSAAIRFGFGGFGWVRQYGSNEAA